MFYLNKRLNPYKHNRQVIAIGDGGLASFAITSELQQLLGPQMVDTGASDRLGCLTNTVEDTSCTLD